MHHVSLEPRYSIKLPAAAICELHVNACHRNFPTTLNFLKHAQVDSSDVEPFAAAMRPGTVNNS